jgi:hypothetical protein
MMEPFAGPSSMTMGNQPMPLRYPLCKRLSEGGVQGFLLTLWSDGEKSFFSKHINDVLPNLIAPKRSICPSPALPSAVATTLLHLLCCAGMLLVGCCVIFIRWRPSKATTYFCCRFFFIDSPLQAMRQHPPTRSAPVAFPLQCPFHR